MKLEESDKEDITTNIKQDFKKNECNAIGNQKKWTRNCPNCNRSVKHQCSQSCRKAKEQFRFCRSCAQKSRPSHGWVPPKDLEEFKRKISNKLRGIPKSQETRNKIRLSRLGKKATSETRRKLREISQNRIINRGLNSVKVFPSYSIKSCRYFDKLNEDGFNIRHALNGGEFRFRGYFADGYDESSNTWYEWDEDHHYYKDGTLKQKDLERQIEITKHLNCKFVRIREKDII